MYLKETKEKNVCQESLYFTNKLTLSNEQKNKYLKLTSKLPSEETRKSQQNPN